MSVLTYFALFFINEVKAQSITDLQFFTQEILIEDQKIAKNLFYELSNVPVHKASLVAGLYTKHDRYLSCERDPDHRFRCYLYLSLEADGSFSSFWSDPDFGKGSLMEAITTKPMKSKTELSVENENLKMKFSGEIANKVFEKSFLAQRSLEEGENFESETLQGKHIQCTFYEYRDDQNIEKKFTQCTVSVPINFIPGVEKEEPVLEKPKALMY